MSLSRRTLLRLAGLAAVPRVARAATPDEVWTRDAHSRLSQGAPQVLRADERATVAAIADAIIPRTDSPGALDVAAPTFVELLVAEWVSAAERDAFRTGLAEIDAHAREAHGAAWPALTYVQQQLEIGWGETTAPTATAGQDTFRRLKGWLVHGWLSSERVQREVLRTNLVPGAFDGCAPLSTGGRD